MYLSQLEQDVMKGEWNNHRCMRMFLLRTLFLSIDLTLSFSHFTLYSTRVRTIRDTTLTLITLEQNAGDFREHSTTLLILWRIFRWAVYFSKQNRVRREISFTYCRNSGVGEYRTLRSSYLFSQVKKSLSSTASVASEIFRENCRHKSQFVTW